MHQELRHLILADKLLDKEEEVKFLPSFQACCNGQCVPDGELEWLMTVFLNTCKRFEESMPDFEDLIDSSLTHKLNKLSEDFKHTQDCFGFDIPNYDNAFLPYKTKLSNILEKWI